MTTQVHRRVPGKLGATTLTTEYLAYTTGALHSIEASFLADTSLRKLRTAFFKVVWSSRQPLANIGCWSATLTKRVRLVIARLVLIFVLPLDFHRRLRAIRTMFIPGALHGIEACLRKQRTAISRAVWSGRQPLAKTECSAWFA